MNHEWTLDPDSEAQHLLPYLEGERDEVKRTRVRTYVAKLVESPLGRGEEHESGVYSATVPRTGIGLIWTLDLDQRIIVLALVGPV
jgi:hypothetical protein